MKLSDLMRDVAIYALVGAILFALLTLSIGSESAFTAAM